MSLRDSVNWNRSCRLSPPAVYSWPAGSSGHYYPRTEPTSDSVWLGYIDSFLFPTCPFLFFFLSFFLVFLFIFFLSPHFFNFTLPYPTFLISSFLASCFSIPACWVNPLSCLLSAWIQDIRLPMYWPPLGTALRTFLFFLLSFSSLSPWHLSHPSPFDIRLALTLHLTLTLTSDCHLIRPQLNIYRSSCDYCCLSTSSNHQSSPWFDLPDYLHIYPAFFFVVARGDEGSILTYLCATIYLPTMINILYTFDCWYQWDPDISASYNMV